MPACFTRRAGSLPEGARNGSGDGGDGVTDPRGARLGTVRSVGSSKRIERGQITDAPVATNVAIEGVSSVRAVRVRVDQNPRDFW